MRAFAARMALVFMANSVFLEMFGESTNNYVFAFFAGVWAYCGNPKVSGPSDIGLNVGVESHGGTN